MAGKRRPHRGGSGEKLLDPGPAALTDAELLAMLLQTGHRGCTALQLAVQLLEEFSGLRGVLAADSDRLLSIGGIGKAKCARLRSALELARRQALQTLADGDVLSSPSVTRSFLQHHLGSRQREVFSCLFLDSQHRVLRCEDLFPGHPRRGRGLSQRGGRQGAAVPGRGSHICPQSPLRRGPAQFLLTGALPSGCARRWRYWTFVCWTTSLSAVEPSILSPRRVLSSARVDPIRPRSLAAPACHKAGVLV